MPAKTNIKNVVCVEGKLVSVADKLAFLQKISRIKLECNTQTIGNGIKGYRILCYTTGSYISGRMPCKDIKRWLDGAIAIMEVVQLFKRIEDAENGN